MLCVKRTDTSDWPCTIARSAAVLGDHWNLILIREACLGTRRFDDFQAALGIGRNILTRRLNGLVDEGVMVRVEYQAHPPRHEYRLTEKGRDAYPILAAMAAWGDRWLVGPKAHRSCSITPRAATTCTPSSSAANATPRSTCARSAPHEVRARPPARCPSDGPIAKRTPSRILTRQAPGNTYAAATIRSRVATLCSLVHSLRPSVARVRGYALQSPSMER